MNFKTVFRLRRVFCPILPSVLSEKIDGIPSVTSFRLLLWIRLITLFQQSNQKFITWHSITRASWLGKSNCNNACMVVCAKMLLEQLAFLLLTRRMARVPTRKPYVMPFFTHKKLTWTQFLCPWAVMRCSNLETISIYRTGQRVSLWEGVKGKPIGRGVNY